jgi:hypothetical protein
MCGEKFPLLSMGVGANSQAWADGERGPQLARAKIGKQFFVFLKNLSFNILQVYWTTQSLLMLGLIKPGCQYCQAQPKL